MQTPRCWAPVVTVFASLAAITCVQDAWAIATFGPARPISQLSFTDVTHEAYPAIAFDDDGHAVAIWSSYHTVDGTETSSPDMVAARSLDGGHTWDPGSGIDPNGEVDEGHDLFPEETHLVHDGRGNWIAAWRVRYDEAVVFRSVDGGTTWTESFSFDPVHGEREALASETATGTVLFAVPESETAPACCTYRIRVFRSADGGQSWSSALVPVPQTSPTALASGGGGTWMLLWTEFDGGDSYLPWVMASVSSDDGITWGPAVPVLRGLDPTAASDGAGVWMVAAAARQGSFDQLVEVATSNNDGITWSATRATPIMHHWFDRIGLFLDAAGHWNVIASGGSSFEGAAASDSDILATFSDDDGVSWAPARGLTGSSRGGLEPPGYSRDGELYVAGDGTSFLAIWASTDPLRYDLGYGLDLGPDEDILIARGRSDCPAVPRVNCRRSTRVSASSLSIKDPYGKLPSLQWIWGAGEATSELEFADPTLDTDYVGCLYVGSALVAEQHMDDEYVCRHEPCWQLRPHGFFFGDAGGIHGGVRSMGLTAGEDGKAGIKMKAGGPALGLPRLPLQSDPAVEMQLTNLDNDLCWSSRFDAAMISSATRFRARGE